MTQAKWMYRSRIRKLLESKNEYIKKADPEFEGYRVEDLANVVGVSRQTMQAWMSDSGVDRLPKAQHQKRLEQFFDLPWQRFWYIVAEGESTDESETPQELAVAVA